MTRLQRIAYMVVTLIAGVFVLVYRGPYWEFIRGHGGDWLVVQFLYLVFRPWISDRWRYSLALGILVLGALVEVTKYFLASAIPHTFFAEITLGSTFDPSDMFAFALGLLTVLSVEALLLRSRQAEARSLSDPDRVA